MTYRENVGQVSLPIEALGFQATVSKHLDDLGVFLALLLKRQLSLLVVILVLPPSTVLATLSLILGHSGNVSDDRCSRRIDPDVVPEIQRFGERRLERRRVDRKRESGIGIIKIKYHCQGKMRKDINNVKKGNKGKIEEKRSGDI